MTVPDVPISAPQCDTEDIGLTSAHQTLDSLHPEAMTAQNEEAQQFFQAHSFDVRLEIQLCR